MGVSDFCKGAVTRRMSGGVTPSGVVGAGALSGDPLLKVMLLCNGEVKLRKGEETESCFFPALAKSLVSIDCNNMRGDNFGQISDNGVDDFVDVSKWMKGILMLECVENAGD